MKMLAQRLYGPKDLRWEEVDVPELAPGDVRIKVAFCGVCGTDYAIYSGETSFYEMGLIRTPMTLGHEYSGVIDGVGEGVTKFKVGDSVIADTGISCGVCEKCLRGDYFSCDKMQAVGTINCVDGAYAQYTTMPERHVLNLPEGVSLESGALCEPMATSLNALIRPHVKLGDSVMIIGTGAIGLSAIPFARLMGANQVILGGRKDFKLEIGKSFGADYIINMTKEDMAQRVKEITGGNGPDVIVEASGAEEMLHFSLDNIADNGRLSVVSFYEKIINNVDIDKIVLSNISLVSALGSQNTAHMVARLMKDRNVDVTPMITAIYPLEKAEQALIDSKKLSAEHIKILLKA